LRVGIVGAGTMGTAHAEGWCATDATLVGIVANDAAAAARLASSWGAAVYVSLDAMLADVDVVDLCVPSDLHRPMTEQAAAAGKHVVCEKPMALNVQDAQAMIDACERAGVRLFIAHVLRFFPEYRSAADLVRNGAIGAPGVLRLKRVAYPPHAGVASWFSDERRSGGVVFDLMIHDLDYARLVGGPVERVYAKAIPTSDAAPFTGTARSYVLATLRFESGAIALVEGGWAYPSGTFRTGFDLAGSDGVLEWSSDDTATIRSFLPAEDASAASVGLPRTGAAESAYTRELRHVHHALAHDAPFEVQAEEALEAVRLAAAVRRSLDEDRPVTVREVG